MSGFTKVSTKMDNSNLLEFLELVGKLKHTKRTGWVLKDVNEPECIAGHMYRMAMMTFFLNDKDDLDRSKCVQMALVHDLAEAIVGDITPYYGITVEEKHKQEKEAMENISSLLGPSGAHISELFEEYEAATSPEAKFVKDLDRFDMILQAYEYEKRDNTPKKMQEFFDNTKNKFNHPLIKDLVQELDKKRAQLETSNSKDNENVEKL